MYSSLSSERTIETLFLSSSKEHPLFSLKEVKMLGGTETLKNVCGEETAGHRDGVQSRYR